MGTVFSLYKRNPKQRYELGKIRHGFPPELSPPEQDLIEGIEALNKTLYSKIGPPSTQDLVDHYATMTRLTNPAWSVMWSIMGTPDYSVFKLSKFNEEALADLLYRASQNIDSMVVARKVACHMLEWSGDDDITLNPEEPDDLAELGWPTRGYRNTGSIWDAMKN